MRLSHEEKKRELRWGSFRLLSFSIVILCGHLVTPTGAEAATIRGRVLSENDGLYLGGVRIEIIETEQETFSERGGDYILRGLLPGSYTVRFSYTGLPSVIERVDLATDNTVITLNPAFSPAGTEVIELDEFVVEGTILGSAKAIAQMRAAENLVNIVAADAFGQFTDRNPAEALQRLPGVTVEQDQGEGQFVIIRGANPDLNSVAIDGVVAATPDAGGRRTGLNIISIDQLESIEVTKTWLPTQWANFIGGSVNLVTRSALDRDQRFGSIETAFGQYTLAEENSYRVNAVYGDVFKLDDTGEHLVGLQVSLDVSEDNRGSETLRVSPYSTDVPWEVRNMPGGLNLPGYDLEDYEIKRERTGFSSKLEYRLNENHEWAASFSHNEFDDDEVEQETSFEIQLNNYGGDRFLTESIALELGYDLNDDEVQRRINVVGTTNEKRLRSDEVFALGDVVFNEDTKLYTYQRFGASSTKSWLSELTEETLTTWQLTGQHRFFERLLIDYKVYRSEAEQKKLQQRYGVNAPNRNSESGLENGKPFVRIAGDAFADPQIYTTGQFQTLLDNFDLSEDDRSGGELNLDVAYTLGQLQASAEIGVAGDYRDKSFDRDYFSRSEIDAGLSPNSELRLDNPAIVGETNNDFLSSYGPYAFGTGFDTPSLRGFIDEPDDLVVIIQTNDDENESIVNDVVQNYDAEEDVEAFYFLQSLEWKHWKLLFGFRHEKTRNTFKNFNIITRPEEPIGALRFIQPVHWRLIEERLGRDSILEESIYENEYEHTLPAFHLTRRMGDNWVIRAAATQTIKRPTFTDLIPREIPDISGASFGTRIQLPNFDLRPLESTNYDLSIDYFFKGLGKVSLGVFYKELDGPIYEERREIEVGQAGWEELSEKFDSAFTRDPETGAVLNSSNNTWDTSRMANAGKGRLQGIEFSIERDFDFLPEPFNGLGGSFNLSLMDSEVELLRPERSQISTSSGEIITLDPTVSLFQQPDTTANASLYYKRDAFLIRLSYNYRGEALRSVLVTESTLEDLVDDIGLEASALDSFDAPRERIDLFLQYTWKHSLTLFLEATNITNEPNERYYGDASRLQSIQYTEPVYFVGLQWKL